MSPNEIGEPSDGNRRRGFHAWFLATLGAAPVLAHPDWEDNGPHRITLCASTASLRLPQADPSTYASPNHADLWVLPVTQRPSAAGYGPVVEHCEIAFPATMFADPDLSIVRRCHPFTLQLIERIRQLAPRTDVTAKLLVSALNESMRLHLIDRFTEPGASGIRGPRLLDVNEQARLIDYIDKESIELGSTVAALADQVGMTIDTFKKAFVATFHTTPRQFVLDRRIAMARVLLADSGHSIADVSARLGFSSTSHFTTVFKKRVGVPPAEFRPRWPK
ncbi:helix-turn-helix transcriptional regulator [Mycolicibacterium mageritense]|uniref:helix-turn-helix transcriptional regulator n=1 Tax=Mycolicibacterium mageritense TaxID=53462 RepID=UPI001E64D910|nr:helix-turn-helix transcriptional regulator [Mycolicibacterium mageritense]GJJ23090.1 putative transcriptional regulator, AraC family protein [Mycolicibacterium mageritense]